MKIYKYSLLDGSRTIVNLVDCPPMVVFACYYSLYIDRVEEVWYNRGSLSKYVIRNGSGVYYDSSDVCYRMIRS